MLLLATILGLILYIAVAMVWMTRDNSTTASSVAYFISTLVVILILSMFGIEGDRFLSIVFYLLALRDLMIVLYIKRGQGRKTK